MYLLRLPICWSSNVWILPSWLQIIQWNMQLGLQWRLIIYIDHRPYSLYGHMYTMWRFMLAYIGLILVICFIYMSISPDGDGVRYGKTMQLRQWHWDDGFQLFQRWYAKLFHMFWRIPSERSEVPIEVLQLGLHVKSWRWSKNDHLICWLIMTDAIVYLGDVTLASPSNSRHWTLCM